MFLRSFHIFHEMRDFFKLIKKISKKKHFEIRSERVKEKKNKKKEKKRRKCSGVPWHDDTPSSKIAMKSTTIDKWLCLAISIASHKSHFQSLSDHKSDHTYFNNSINFIFLHLIDYAHLNKIHRLSIIYDLRLE